MMSPPHSSLPGVRSWTIASLSFSTLPTTAGVSSARMTTAASQPRHPEIGRAPRALPVGDEDRGEDDQRGRAAPAGTRTTAPAAGAGRRWRCARRGAPAPATRRGSCRASAPCPTADSSRGARRGYWEDPGEADHRGDDRTGPARRAEAADGDQAVAERGEHHEQRADDREDADRVGVDQVGHRGEGIEDRVAGSATPGGRRRGAGRCRSGSGGRAGTGRRCRRPGWSRGSGRRW